VGPTSPATICWTETAPYSDATVEPACRVEAMKPLAGRSRGEHDARGPGNVRLLEIPLWLQFRLALNMSGDKRDRTGAHVGTAAHTETGPISRRQVLAAVAAAAGAAWLADLGHTGSALAGDDRLALDGPMTARRLAGILREERARWAALMARVGPARMEVPGVEGAWSVKQIVAHLTWYEHVIVEGARQLTRTGSYARTGMRAMSMDERNALIAAQSNARALGDVLAESERVFAQLLSVIAACPDEILNDPQRLGLPEDVVPWQLVANNSYAHYREHEQAIEAWLARS